MSERSLYDQALEHSSHVWCVWPDGIVTNGRTRPTRDELIESLMRVPEYTVRRDPATEMCVRSGPTYWTREKAEQAVGGHGRSEGKEEAA